MNNLDDVRRDNERARQGTKPFIHNEVPMRPRVAESFDDAKVPLPNIETINKD
jgi:hypothetical protein